ncbi:exodeoxyribonuclease VII large subunit [Sphingorhabdus sp. EL138]|uniref:exodeoxyribonuclease VII large subunit n=1 Tax=Sphingorhabdus sp. EL138 TaxID=2073156 RepID=UPI0025E3037B|nr:exodeoxyribonuclease VII large subunit [Sphingorhabdus sp. EL138]
MSANDPFETGDPQVARLLAEERPGDNAQAMSVSELSIALKRTVEDRFGHVRVRGEISGFKRAASGHIYFSLKDDNARLEAVMWKGGAARLPFAPEDGLEVVATGKLTTYAGRSNYQIVVDSLEVAGEGAMMLLFEKLKARLAAEGLFAPERKKKLPALPRTIGVVTSPTGAVIRDILHRLADRFPTHVIVWPVLVQGEGSAAQIARAVNGFSAMPQNGPATRPDLVIVARGGGSIEDLWAFNDEAVVRAVADCTIPIISAVGHETDTTLCDFAADLRAPTPTAAAEIAVPVRNDLLQRVGQLGLRMANSVRKHVDLAAERLEAQRRLMPRLSDLAAPHQLRTDDLAERLRQSLRTRVGKAEIAYSGPAMMLHPRLLTRRIEQGQQRLDALTRLAGSLHPEAPLKRGFARVTDADGKTIMSRAAAIKAGDVTLRFVDGEVGSVVVGAAPPRSVTPKPNTPTVNQGNLFDG